MSNNNNDKTYVVITSINTQSDCNENEIKINYQIMTSDQANKTYDHIYYGTDRLEQHTNKIMLEKPDPKLLYTIFQLLGRTAYSVIEYKKDGLKL